MTEQPPPQQMYSQQQLWKGWWSQVSKNGRGIILTFLFKGNFLPLSFARSHSPPIFTWDYQDKDWPHVLIFHVCFSGWPPVLFCLDFNFENSRIMPQQSRIWDLEGILGVLDQPWKVLNLQESEKIPRCLPGVWLFVRWTQKCYLAEKLRCKGNVWRWLSS